MKKINKKGGERVLSFYLFIIYIIVLIGIVSGVVLFRGSALDVRELEASILTDSLLALTLLPKSREAPPWYHKLLLCGPSKPSLLNRESLAGMLGNT